MAKILIVNKFYYYRGGDCTATLALEQLLKQQGHQVAIFSSAHPLNIESVWDSYFPSEINFAQGGLKAKVSAISRLFFSKEIKTKFNQLLDDFQPDIIHAHNIHSYISPYIVKIAAARGIKVVWTLHDYKLICPAYSCLRNNRPCELCFHNKSAVIQHKCMKRSLKASISAYIEALVWNRNVLERCTDTFISPSFFLKEKMVSAGFNNSKIKVLHNFIENILPVQNVEKENYYCYIGRLSPEKGIDLLLKVAESLPHRLKIVGGGTELSCFQQRKYKNIDFVGHQPRNIVFQIIQKARFTIIPSICYENNPFSIIESLCSGTPVLGANIGGIPELITAGVNGYLFAPNDADDMRSKITQCFDKFDNSYPFSQIASEAQNKFSASMFYNKLISIYGL